MIIRAVMMLPIVFLAASCGGGQGNEPRRDINVVKDEAAPRLMSISGVVGVYVGALDSGEPCIGIMVVKRTATLDSTLPASIEGYPVRVEETGQIRPMEQENR